MTGTTEQARSAGEGSSPLVTDRGTTTVKNAVVTSIVSKAVKEISGAEPEIAGRSTTLPGDSSPTVGEFFGKMTGSGRGTRGISAEVGREETAVDVTVTVPYGRSIPDLTRSIRDTIIQRVENMTGLRVTEVNITVKDVSFPQQ